jgi:hypothetical protein
MRDKALITSMNDDSILVMPLLRDTCINCNESSCAKRGTAFPVDNPYKLPIACGDIVSITAKKSVTALQGFFSLLFPITCAIVGFAVSAPLSRALNTSLSEGLKAVCVLLGLVFAVIIVLVISSYATKHTKAAISQIHAQ